MQPNEPCTVPAAQQAGQQAVPTTLLYRKEAFVLPLGLGERELAVCHYTPPDGAWCSMPVLLQRCLACAQQEHSAGWLTLHAVAQGYCVWALGSCGGSGLPAGACASLSSIHADTCSDINTSTAQQQMHETVCLIVLIGCA